jgi:hypothetical protein
MCRRIDTWRGQKSQKTTTAEMIHSIEKAQISQRGGNAINNS